MKFISQFVISFKTALPFAMLLLTACGGCVLGASRETSTEAPPPPQSKQESAVPLTVDASKNSGTKIPDEAVPEVQGDLVRKLEKLVVEKGIKEGFGLFSEGGFSGIGNGQYMVLVSEKGTVSLWYSSTANEPTGSEQFKEVPSQKAKEFTELTPSFDELPSIKATAFDAFTYSYIHVKNVSGKVSRLKSLSIQNLISDRPEAKPYNDVLSSFKATTSN